MINAVRIILLATVFGVVGTAGFYFLKNGGGTSIEMDNIRTKVMEKGVDVEIENFRVVHEVKGVKEWELKAGLAQINNQENLTKMRDVKMTLHKDENRKYIIVADSGTYKEKTDTVDLVGNVKFTGTADILVDRLSSDSAKK